MPDKTLGGYIRTTLHPDDMDGGVTAALIEKEATDPDGDGLAITTQDGKVWITCTGESSEVTVGPIRKDVLAEMIQDRDADESRPLTPDAITDEMVQRGMDRFCELDVTGREPLMHVIGETLRAALTEPPARPAWQDLADEVEDLMTQPTPATPALLARLLYARGVRVVGGEDPR